MPPSLALLLLITACARFVGEPQAGPTSTPVPASSPAILEGPKFIPASYMEGTSKVTPLTFPDGSTAELVAPENMDVFSAGVSPIVVLSSPGFSKEFLIEHRPVDQILSSVRSPTLLAEYDGGGGGQVGFWDLDGDGKEHLDYLLVGFGRWSAYIWDYTSKAEGISSRERMTDEDRALWARNLRGHETADGFLVLEVLPPLEMAGSVNIWGPRLLLEGAVGGAYVLLGPCELDPYDQLKPEDIEHVNGLEVARRDGAPGAGWCVPTARMKVEVFGPPRFVDAAIHGLGVRNVRLVP